MVAPPHGEGVGSPIPAPHCEEGRVLVMLVMMIMMVRLIMIMIRIMNVEYIWLTSLNAM